MNILEIKNFSKTYKGNKKAVDNLSITVEAGDIYGFIGHNGAGKSTTIKSVVGVLEFTEGEIYIDGHSVKNPFCVKCYEEGHITMATVVDHIKPHRGDQKLFWDRSNWQPLCEHHHNVKTMTEDRFKEYRF